MYAIYIRLQFPFLAPLVPLSCAATLGQMGRRENTVQSFCVHGCRAQYHITRYVCFGKPSHAQGIRPQVEPSAAGVRGLQSYKRLFALLLTSYTV